MFAFVELKRVLQLYRSELQQSQAGKDSPFCQSLLNENTIVIFLSPHHE